MVLPSLLNLLIKLRIILLPLGSNPAVGSSRTKISGFKAMIPAIATDFLAKLMNYLTTDFYGKEYFVNEVMINKKLE